ncbi:phosphonate ABC transporter ATP-binding protein [Anoxynatronum sibiricum]|uniref:Phosphonate ABC transporter ATP-binding protein n=1 Tax=Anoxynatronum sibiricum TaxID=210623 RepID=A0ABU9VT87_9CLOT
MLHAKGVNKTYKNKVQALKNIDLDLCKGEFAVLLGLSGAGKSTLLRCINGLVPIDSGDIIFENQSVLERNKLTRLRKDIGMIFQQFNIIKRLSVLENVLCGRLAYNSSIPSSLRLFPKEEVEWALTCIEKVGLEDKALTRSDQLSGGQQQRVGIARALAQKPKLILADEPVASLDPYSSEEIMELLHKINALENITLLMSLHQVDLAKKYGKRIIGLKGGHIVFDQLTPEVTRDDLKLIYSENHSHEEREGAYDNAHRQKTQ